VAFAGHIGYTIKNADCQGTGDILESPIHQKHLACGYLKKGVLNADY
jgi:hypothetical protein